MRLRCGCLGGGRGGRCCGVGTLTVVEDAPNQANARDKSVSRVPALWWACAAVVRGSGTVCDTVLGAAPAEECSGGTDAEVSPSLAFAAWARGQVAASSSMTDSATTLEASPLLGSDSWRACSVGSALGCGSVLAPATRVSVAPGDTATDPVRPARSGDWVAWPGCDQAAPALRAAATADAGRRGAWRGGRPVCPRSPPRTLGLKVKCTARSAASERADTALSGRRELRDRLAGGGGGDGDTRLGAPARCAAAVWACANCRRAEDGLPRRRLRRRPLGAALAGRDGRVWPR